MSNPYLDHGLVEARKATELAVDHEACNEAVSNTVAWASIALDRLVENGTPAIHASSLIIGILHTNLMAKLLEPPDDDRIQS